MDSRPYDSAREGDGHDRLGRRGRRRGADRARRRAHRGPDSEVQEGRGEPARGGRPRGREPHPRDLAGALVSALIILDVLEPDDERTWQLLDGARDALGPEPSLE